MIRLSKEQIIAMHSRLIEKTGGEDGVLNEGMLDSAIESPFQTFDGVDLYSSISEKAARFGYCLIANHSMRDGNKRIGAHAMLVFLTINGVRLSYSQEDLVDIVMDVASGKASYEDLLSWITAHSI